MKASAAAPNPTPEQKCGPQSIAWHRPMKRSSGSAGLCVSVKMHTQGMSVADGAKFFHENCYYEEKPSLSGSDARTFDPGYPELHLEASFRFSSCATTIEGPGRRGFSRSRSFTTRCSTMACRRSGCLREILLTDELEVDAVPWCEGIALQPLAGRLIVLRSLLLRSTSSFLRRQQIRQQRLRMRGELLHAVQSVFRWCATYGLDFIDLVGGLFAASFSPHRAGRRIFRTPLLTVASKLQTSLDRFWIARVRKPICETVEQRRQRGRPSENHSALALHLLDQADPPDRFRDKVPRWAET